jgi:hypothetical protein
VKFAIALFFVTVIFYLSNSRNSSHDLPRPLGRKNKFRVNPRLLLQIFIRFIFIASINTKYTDKTLAKPLSRLLQNPKNTSPERSRGAKIIEFRLLPDSRDSEPAFNSLATPCKAQSIL